ncbi:MAG: ABC transporter substrate-binding protein [Pseudomonadota bacterium]
MFRTHFFGLGFALCAASAVASASPTPAGKPETSAAAEAVSRFHLTLTDAMRRSAVLGCEGRYKLMQPAVEATFDLPGIAARALRRHWKTLDERQREAFTTAMRTSFITTYATEFSTPGAVSFATGQSERMANGDALVHTTLTPKGHSAITLDYVLKAQGEHWQVVNVLADGVSDLALRASQYDGLMKSDGMAALLEKIHSQTLQLKARCK